VCSSDLPAALLYSNASFIFLNGLAAAFVAKRLRAHVRAEIAESHLREGMQREMEIASSIQRGLLPKDTPHFPGYEIAGWNRPADRTGGDYYDWQPLANQRLALSVADVAGHGLGPALVTAFCRAYARASIRSEPDLETVVSRINELLSEDLPPDRFVTFVIALLTQDSGKIDLLSAGHGPILIHRAATGNVESRNADDVPLGVMPDTVFTCPEPIMLDVGDSLIIVTDGFFEWMNDQHELFGIERLKDSIANAASLDAPAMIQAVRKDVERFAGGTIQADDLTMVVARRKGTST